MYRVELFDLSKSKFRDACIISEKQTISFDYLVPESFQLICPKMKAEILDAVRISAQDEKIFEGYISAVENNDRKTILSVAPFIKLIDVMSVQNTENIWAQQIYNQLYYDFFQTNPSLYPLPLKYIGGLSNWNNIETVYSEKEKLESDMTCIISAAEITGKFMKFCITDDWKIGFSFLSTPSKQIIETDLGNIINKEINVDTNSGYNIAMIWYPNLNSSGYVHTDAYLLDDGSVSFNHNDCVNVTNPRITAQKQDKAFETETEKKNALLEMLKPKNSNNQIILSIKKTDKIIDAVNMQIGQPADIISNGITYSSMLTGKNYNGETIELIFGGVRQELTKKLQRRSKQ